MDAAGDWEGGGVKVLVACEESGTVRDAFLLGGHDAMSCDIQPTRKPGRTTSAMFST